MDPGLGFDVLILFTEITILFPLGGFNNCLKNTKAILNIPHSLIYSYCDKKSYI